jgi:hypothetical protein
MTFEVWCRTNRRLRPVLLARFATREAALRYVRWTAEDRPKWKLWIVEAREAA